MGRTCWWGRLLRERGDASKGEFDIRYWKWRGNTSRWSVEKRYKMKRDKSSSGTEWWQWGRRGSGRCW